MKTFTILVNQQVSKKITVQANSKEEIENAFEDGYLTFEELTGFNEEIKDCDSIICSIEEINK